MNLFFNQQRNTKVRAFTLLEVLASFAIVTLVILGPLTFSINSASYSRQSKDVLTAQYLAQEALELLHYQYDTLYIACSNEKDACDTLIVPTIDGETKGAKAWRLFKTRLSDTSDGSASCFSSDGCSFDFLDMLNATSTTPPKKYVPLSNKCPKLSMVYSALDGNVINYYVCSSIDQADLGNRLKDNHFTVKQSAYSRKVNVVSVPTFNEVNSPSSPVNIGLYQDDLIVTATVSFRRSNGVMRNIEVVDFFHARS